MKPVIFSAEAEEEWRRSVDYYERQKAGLGLEFEEDIRSAALTIAQNPQRWPQIGSAQRYLLTRFPFSLFYLDFPDCVYVIAVAHMSREPFYWKDRTK
ncbi:MAG: type II toxin-antitoxin system RelE/ParE family toxin [Candidatus Omnitrophota bacterium]